MNDVLHLVTKSQQDSPKTASPTKKGYWIAHIDVSDPQRYALYGDVYEVAFTNYGARYIVRGGSQHLLEGEVKSRTVVVEFESLQSAVDCYESFEAQQAKALRTPFACSDLVIVEGYEDA